MKKEVDYSRTDRIVTLTINRPEERNMLSDEVLDELNNHLTALDQDGSVFVVVIKGEGPDFFCGGAFNPGQVHKLTHEQIHKRRRAVNELFDRIETLTHPVIAAVNGRAQAAGFEMVLACDIRIAASHATFAMPENKWGLFPGAGGPLRLPRLVGTGHAMEIIMTGRDVEAKEALSIGLVERVLPPSEFEDGVRRLAEAIAASGPLSNRAAKKLTRASLEIHMQALRAYSDSLRGILMFSEDSAEGVAAHLEGRPPRFNAR